MQVSGGALSGLAGVSDGALSGLAGVSGGALPVVARGKVLLVPEELGDILPKLLPGDGGAGLRQGA